MLRSLEESLQRLGVDAIDIVYLHDPDEHRREVLETAYPALEELRGQGVVSAIGAGMNQAAMLADFARHTDMDVLMLAGRYTLLEQSALNDLLPVCQRRGIGIVAAGVFNSGLLARRAPADAARYNYADAPRRSCCAPGAWRTSASAMGRRFRRSPWRFLWRTLPSSACASARVRRSRSSATSACTDRACPPLSGGT